MDQTEYVWDLVVRSDVRAETGVSWRLRPSWVRPLRPARRRNSAGCSMRQTGGSWTKRRPGWRGVLSGTDEGMGAGWDPKPTCAAPVKGGCSATAATYRSRRTSDTPSRRNDRRSVPERIAAARSLLRAGRARPARRRAPRQRWATP